tara:strand:+ start:607 stop:951 length:345 start_codon:yes stop_codon:yes gene_type:complete
MKIAFDLDDTVLTQGSPDLNYKDSEVKPEMLAYVNALYDDGHEIYFFSARHFKHYVYTDNFLKNAGFKYHGLVLNKPSVDLFVDDRGFRWDGDRRQELLYLIDSIEEKNGRNNS